MGIKEVWVICRIKRLDPAGREEAKVSHANKEGCLLRRLWGGPAFPRVCGCVLHTNQHGLQTAPISQKSSLPGFCSSLLLLRLETGAQRWSVSRPQLEEGKTETCQDPSWSCSFTQS